MALRIRQYASYRIANRTFSPAEITRRIGLAPDRSKVMAAPPRLPRWHIWQLGSDADPEVDLTTQISTLVDRLRPYKDQILSVVADIKAAEPGRRGSGHSLLLIRHFDQAGGVLDGYEHRLLSWWFAPGVLQFLAEIDVDFGADEYGQDFSWWQWRHKRRYYAPVKPGNAELIATDVSINEIGSGERGWCGTSRSDRTG